MQCKRSTKNIWYTKNYNVSHSPLHSKTVPLKTEITVSVITNWHNENRKFYKLGSIENSLKSTMFHICLMDIWGLFYVAWKSLHS